ncbi:MAG: hypothetical protein JO348_07935 [Alphaproteobacteria bacterium]|nr:hypothetical protein [Alphaproteobacteria bacterium]MBV9539724.1 hypothetical protein [Alphaproteobacteria bacterium]MBV9903924.1 hypothetical protein [Alphaproteobacteria bacterium]
MAGKGQAAKGAGAPSISDEKVKAATGRNWMGWFVILNRANANARPHKEVATLLKEKYGVPPWWSQMITVEYERARGGRALNERPGGTFSVNVTKVFPVPLPALFKAVTDPKKRAAWFPKGTFEESSKTENKYWRGKWKNGRIELGFYAKGDAKSQLTLESSKLAKAEDVEKERAAWKKAFEKLGGLLA